jgi:hypothetical protein
MKVRGVRPEQRKGLQERSGGMCEICGYPGNNAHHRKNAGQGGNDDLSNLLLLCGSGTTGCHGYVTAPVKNYPLWPANPKRNGWSVWRSDIPYDIPVWYRGHWARLDDGGHVHLLKEEQVRNVLGHLQIERLRPDQAIQPGLAEGYGGQRRHSLRP